jgi:carbonyl reductase 1
MKRILITGANKGIGFAMVQEVLRQHDDTLVYLGSRDSERGQQARARILAEEPSWENRVISLTIDVADDASVEAAAQSLAAKSEGSAPHLYGIVNNAGIGLGNFALNDVLQVNTYGVKRVCDAFLPLVDPNGGRIVNITSASGPNYVATCDSARQQTLTNPAVTWGEIADYMEECVSIEGNEAAFEAKGLGDGSAYGISKACANAYTIYLARTHANLVINACTPGFIETDLTRHYAESKGMSPGEMGMKTPAEGTTSALFLLFGTPEGRGYYFGSDAKRSPLDKYRSPGSPAYTGE